MARIRYPGFIPAFVSGGPIGAMPGLAFDPTTTPYTSYIWNGAWFKFGAAVTFNATSLQGTAVAATAPTPGQVLTYNGTQWAPH